MEHKVYDRKYERTLKATVNPRKVYEKSTENPLQNSRFKYNPDKKPPTTRYYNQRYSDTFEAERSYSEGEQQKRFDQRSESFHKWRQKENRVSRAQLKNEPQNQIGAVSSSWLTSLGYNVAASEAVATFHDSNAEFYYKMPYETFLDWLNSPSKGKWLHDHPNIMHSYTTRSGAGSYNTGGNMFEERLENFRSEKQQAKLKNRGNKRRLNYLSKYR